MKNYYYCLDLNLHNEVIKKYLDSNHAVKLTAKSDTSIQILSRYFLDVESAFKELRKDMNEKAELLKINKLKIPVVALNETNPFYNNTEEELNKARVDDPLFDEYLDTWENNELARLVCTTEFFEEDELPIIRDETQTIFRYVLREFDDEFAVPAGLLLSPLNSMELH